jgi:hypothetical protein
MNNDEQTLIDGLFSRLQQAEKDAGPRDVQADQRIKDHLASQPTAPYYMAQSILVQEAALKRLDQQNKQLQQELTQARSQAQAPAASSASGGGSFLSSLFGGGSREPAPPASSGGGWREPARPAAFGGQPTAPQQAPQGYAQPGQAAAPAAGGFMSGALKTAAGVAGGVLLAQGISSLFHHDGQPQEIVEILQEEPANHESAQQDHAQVADSSQDDLNAGDPVAGNDAWSDPGSDTFASNDYGDQGGGLFSDDDDYV